MPRLFQRDDRPRDPRGGPRRLPPGAGRRAAAVAALTFAALLLYYGCLAMAPSPLAVKAVMLTYMICFGVLLVSYLLYNRGFVNRNVTEEDLPADWPEEKRRSFVEGNRRRAEKSRWMALLMIPFAVVFLAESCYLFLWCGRLETLFRGRP